MKAGTWGATVGQLVSHRSGITFDASLPGSELADRQRSFFSLLVRCLLTAD